MISHPGYALEDLLAWYFDLLVVGSPDANMSLMHAEGFSTASKLRQRLTNTQFSPIVAIYENSRNLAEGKLLAYEKEDHGSWQSYADYNFDEVFTEKHGEKVIQYLKDITWAC